MDTPLVGRRLGEAEEGGDGGTTEAGGEVDGLAQAPKLGGPPSARLKRFAATGGEAESRSLSSSSSKSSSSKSSSSESLDVPESSSSSSSAESAAGTSSVVLGIDSMRCMLRGDLCTEEDEAERMRRLELGDDPGLGGAYFGRILPDVGGELVEGAGDDVFCAVTGEADEEVEGEGLEAGIKDRGAELAGFGVPCFQSVRGRVGMAGIEAGDVLLVSGDGLAGAGGEGSAAVDSAGLNLSNGIF